MKERTFWIALFVVACATSPLFSQTRQENAEIAAARRSEVAVSEVFPAPLDGVAIEAGQANNKATINVSRKVGNQSLIATLSTPVSKDVDATDLASLEGLASELSFSIAYSGFLFPRLDPRFAQTQMTAVCNKYGVINNECDTNGLARAAAIKCGFQSQIIGVKLSDVPDKVEELRNKSAGPAERACLDSQQYRAEDELDFAFFQGRAVQAWAFAAEVGRKPASYFQADGAKKEETNLPYALSASYGWIGSSSRFSLRGRYEMRFKDGKKARLCQPFPSSNTGSGLEGCEELPFGAPTESEAFIANAEFRRFFRKWAMSPIVSYDLEEEVLGLQLPVYLIRNSDGQLTGGFRLGWRDDTNDIVASVFISKPLSLGN
jgi:hypothetical protein